MPSFDDRYFIPASFSNNCFTYCCNLFYLRRAPVPDRPSRWSAARMAELLLVDFIQIHIKTQSHQLQHFFRA